MGIVYLILWYCSGHLKYVQLLLIFNFFYSNKPQFARLPPRLNSFLGGGGGVREGAAKQKRTWLFSAQLLFSSGENFSWNVGGPRAAAGFAFRGLCRDWCIIWRASPPSTRYLNGFFLGQITLNFSNFLLMTNEAYAYLLSIHFVLRSMNFNIVINYQLLNERLIICPEL